MFLWCFSEQDERSGLKGRDKLIKQGSLSKAKPFEKHGTKGLVEEGTNFKGNCRTIL